MALYSLLYFYWSSGQHSITKASTLPRRLAYSKKLSAILMKIYYAAGLKEIAKSSGYHGSTLTSVEQCSNFKRTHYFLLQAWEALYREMFHTYLNSSSHAITADTICILLSSIQQKKPPQHAMKRICELVKDSHTYGII